MLETFIRDHMKGYKGRPGILSDYLLSASYDSVQFLTWSRICREAPKYEERNRSVVEEAYFLGWHNGKLFMIPREKRVKLYSKVPS